MKTQKFLPVMAVLSAFNFLSIHNTQAQVSFASAVNFAAGSGASSVISADFNGDGKADLVTANSGDNNVSVLLGDGLGNFAPAVNLAAGSGASSVISADFNGDGKADLAVANNGSNNVSLLLGNGMGSFSAASSFVVGNNPYGIISADFNGDGKADLAVANSGDDTVSILLNNGSGSFGSVINLAVGTNPRSIISADFNADGKADLAVANNNSNNVSVLFGDGSGGFGNATNFMVVNGPVSIISADFNADGKADLAVANSTDNTVSVLLNNGSGSFGTAINFGVGTNPFSVTSSDFNGDGKADLVTINPIPNCVAVLLGDGMGNFGVATHFTAGSNPGSANSVISADFNGDGKADLAVANFSSNNVSVLLNNTPPSTAPICLVTVDGTNTHNVVVWEKSGLNLVVIDSFLIFREISTNNYQQVGAVSRDSFSILNDYVNPSTTGYRYKLKIKDIYGFVSDFSNYHNTIYLTNIGANFSWTMYQIEGNTTPVATYNVYRDDNSTGSFHLIGNTTGNQFGYTDVDYSSYPNARYYVEAMMTSGACNPTRTGLDHPRSNARGWGINGVQELNTASIKIYPNPVNNILNIEGITEKITLRLYDMVGKLVVEKIAENNNSAINTSQLAEGIYMLSVEGRDGVFNKKVVVSH